MRLPPPTAEGVTAEVNSQSMFTLKTWRQVSVSSLSQRKRAIAPKSLPNINKKANKIPPHIRQEKWSPENNSGLKSL